MIALGFFILCFLFSAGVLALETWLIMIIGNWLIGAFGGIAFLTMGKAFLICCLLNLLKCVFRVDRG